VLPPAPTLVIDAAIFVGAVLGRGGGVLIDAGRTRVLTTTDRVLEEVSRRISLGMRRPELLPVLEELAGLVKVNAMATLNIPEAQAVLRQAVSSDNGSTDDAHVLALAWALDADIWSADRDFAGTGVASWSTPNLLRALKAERSS
jgi:predicted nucleic acid-binding protein